MHRYSISFIFAGFLLALSGAGVLAQKVINDHSGSPFMEEIPDRNSANAPQQRYQPAAQEIKSEDGSIFMEEVPQKTKARKSPRPHIDFSNLGIPVDPSGRIVPLIQPGSGPVLNNFSRLEMDYRPATMYIPYNVYTGPYGGVPQYNWGPRFAPPYSSQYNGVFAVPMGVPLSYYSSSEIPQSQQLDYQLGGSSLGFSPAASIWSPSWQSPWGGSLWLPKINQYQQQGSIRSFFPQDLNQADNNNK